MRAADRRLAALIAAFAGHRGEELASLIATPSAAAIGDRVRTLTAAGREARVAELARALAPAPQARAGVSRGDVDPTPVSAELSAVRRRLRLEQLRSRD